MCTSPSWWTPISTNAPNLVTFVTTPPAPCRFDVGDLAHALVKAGRDEFVSRIAPRLLQLGQNIVHRVRAADSWLRSTFSSSCGSRMIAFTVFSATRQSAPPPGTTRMNGRPVQWIGDDWAASVRVATFCAPTSMTGRPRRCGRRISSSPRPRRLFGSTRASCPFVRCGITGRARAGAHPRVLSWLRVVEDPGAVAKAGRSGQQPRTISTNSRASTVPTSSCPPQTGASLGSAA